MILARDGELPAETAFYSNCITPGTDFMLKLSYALQEWVEYKMKSDPFWASGAHVVVTGPDVPGEGEHKVVDFIREEEEKYNKAEEQEQGSAEKSETPIGAGIGIAKRKT